MVIHNRCHTITISNAIHAKSPFVMKTDLLEVNWKFHLFLIISSILEYFVLFGVIQHSMFSSSIDFSEVSDTNFLLQQPKQHLRDTVLNCCLFSALNLQVLPQNIPLWNIIIKQSRHFANNNLLFIFRDIQQTGREKKACHVEGKVFRSVL